MTIAEIKERTEDTSPHFFSRKTLKFFGQTMRSFSVMKYDDGTYGITAPMYYNGRLCGHTKRLFNPETNRLETTI